MVCDIVITYVGKIKSLSNRVKTENNNVDSPLVML